MKNVRLYIFLYFTAAMSLDVVYRSLDHVARIIRRRGVKHLSSRAQGITSTCFCYPRSFTWPHGFRLSGPPRGSACIF